MTTIASKDTTAPKLPTEKVIKKPAPVKGIKILVARSSSPTSRARKPQGTSYSAKKSASVPAANRWKPSYKRSMGVDAYVVQVNEATPDQMVEIEREGVAGTFIADLSKRMDLPSSRMFAMLRIPPATAARKSASGALVDGRAGLAAVGMIKLLGIAQNIVQDSTSDEARNFDTVRWLGQWIERPQPALGGRKPADYLDTPTGQDIVAKLLGAMRSGAYL
ncbi:antitoxin Xre/MbcA/ParS toxin-binding domain-containing protein [Acidovorax sp. MR-S7]|uniref:antitoxin Xre/MbcA/ParS toxin-binding domain-containing protein n=1 Tax=Acidovorax sp. MR-S7 TaxID=1268622 RepID=UPI0003D3E44E|nr:antitoxin Xre/MbcA/ParS toxin-binding domain-containing protein [Acidovorax sp. MR-S7]GAD22077.1 hypothetical protein AVS7_01837 [Acidovorax sp. MR-S7]